MPKWLLTDISHLQRYDYINIAALDKHIREQLQGTPYLKGHVEFIKDCEATNAADKYKEYGLKILLAVRDEGPKSEQQVRDLMAGSACRFTQMSRLLKKHGLIARARGKHGKFTIPHEK
jgi:hypothetical protein